MILSAQAVPSAAMLPCITVLPSGIAALPSGWNTGGADITSGKVRLWLDSDRAGPQAITVTLTAACDTSGAQQVPSGQPGIRRFDLPPSLPLDDAAALRFYTFPGGCITYQFSFSGTFTFIPGASPALADAATNALSFQPRSALVDYVRRTEGLALCGQGAACRP
jgi:hypothetical protein